MNAVMVVWAVFPHLSPLKAWWICAYPSVRGIHAPATPMQGQELSVVSEKTGHPLWRIVRKSAAQAFQANNMRYEELPRSATLGVQMF